MHVAGFAADDVWSTTISLFILRRWIIITLVIKNTAKLACFLIQHGPGQSLLSRLPPTCWAVIGLLANAYS